MKFGIDCGHNCPQDTGAVGIRVEDELTLEVGRKLMEKLAATGHSVVNCTPTNASSTIDSLKKRVDKANRNEVDIFISIHFNKFTDTTGPMGAEVYGISSASAAIARGILDNLVALGFKNRGVKSAPLYVIKNTSMPAVLIEVCFLDSKADMDLYKKVGSDRIATEIKKALVDEIDDSGETKPGILKITGKTVLKPSTAQSADLPPATLVEIGTGNYPVLDAGFEENHWWVKWPDKTKGNRNIHFIYKDFGKVEPK
jgi:N-acetylmuramoyl-L-alanine amidase